MKLFGNHNNLTKTTLLNYQELEDKFNPITFKSSNKAKYIRISINPDLKVKVTYPSKIKIKKAEDFFQSKLIWTKNNLLKLTKRREIKLKNSKNSQTTLTKQEFLTKNQYLIKRCWELAKKYQFQINNVNLKRQKTIWGSCSSQNNISLNSNLAFLEDKLIDYVILHELIHVKIKNHSHKFWQELTKILPNAKALDKELKNYSPNFFNNL